MKKFISILSALSLILSLSACKNDSDTSGKTAQEAPSSAEPAQESVITPPDEYSVPSDSSGFNFDIPEFDYSSMKVEPVKPADAKFEFDVEDFELNMSDNLSEAELAKMKELSDEQRKMILEKKQSLLTDIATELGKKNVNVQINEVSGEIIMDSSILFDVDSSEVSGEGKAFLQEFVPAYASVICDSKYEGFVEAICVEGHTDTDGTHEYNQKLSEDRANSVSAYCVSDDIGIDDDRCEFGALLKSKGYSYDRPVMGEDGKVDMAASRRVTFRIMINIG